MAGSNPTLTKGAITSRIAAALGGGYAFVWGLIALGTVCGVAAGMLFEEAQRLMFLAAFLIFLVVFCWAFAAKHAGTVWAVLLGGGAVMTTVAWLWSRALT